MNDPTTELEALILLIETVEGIGVGIMLILGVIGIAIGMKRG